MTGIASVHSIVTSRAQGDQILSRVIAALTAKFLVMDLEIGRTATGLTSPSISLQDLFTKPLVRFGIEPQARMFWPDWFTKSARSLAPRKRAVAHQAGT